MAWLGGIATLAVMWALFVGFLLFFSWLEDKGWD